MIYRIRHLTEYVYQHPVSLCYNLAHLQPRNTSYQSCLSSKLQINPMPAYSRKRKDYFGNNIVHFSIEVPHRKLSVEITSEIRIDENRASPELNLDLGNTCAQALEALQQSQTKSTLIAREFVLDSPMVKVMDALRDYAAPSFASDRPLLSAARELTHRIFTDFTYDPAFTTVATPLSDVLEHRRGVCQDFAHLAIGCLRALGFPARYVSGYLETLPPPGQVKMVGSDASHAWFSLYSPDEGWFEFDPTNDNMPAEQHITTAWGRDYSDVAPLRGVLFDGGKPQPPRVAVDVQRVED
ncbi:transglutaminase family protein [Marinobacterium rhizophilum]|uniref:transglutaminase family protein n=1 Tax=Marinobacterium rhizophilum TaxID=420402 RepID=UPI00036D14A5|nr:transglutaminase family protein [Marinobacterium rhizophilum]